MNLFGEAPLWRGKAITILQPSAQAIAAGVKPWENRPRPAPSTLVVGEWVALAAGKAPWHLAHLIRERWPECPADADLPWGAVLGAWRYGGTFSPDGSAWALGPYCYRVEAVKLLPEPIPCRGSQGWWKVPHPIFVAIQRVVWSTP